MKILCFQLALFPIFFLPACDHDDSNGMGNSISRPEPESLTVGTQVGSPIPRLVRDDGAFELVAVVDGVEANRRFMSNLDLVNRQRKNLDAMKKQLATLANESGNTRTSQEATIKALENALQTNDEVMKRTYGYSLSSNHLLIPLEADLFESNEEKSERIPVYEIQSTNEYDRLQDLRNRYDTATKEGTEKTVVANEIAAQLKKEFGFDVNMRYTLDIRKGALYRKVEN